MKKTCLFVFAACALTTACVDHDRCYEDVRYVHSKVVQTESCGCAQKTCGCGCQKESPCGCHQNVPVPAQPTFVPMVQPKTVVVVVPAVKPQPQAQILAQEIVYPEPKKCGCQKNK